MPGNCLIVRGTRLELMGIAYDVARSHGNGVTNAEPVPTCAMREYTVPRCHQHDLAELCPNFIPARRARTGAKPLWDPAGAGK